jgi:hypothetical protein
MAGTSVPAAYANLAASLRLRAGLAGVGVHTLDGPWTDPEAVVLGRADAPQEWATMSNPGIDETVTLAGYLFAERPGNADADADALRTRAGVLLGELAQQLRDDPTLSGAIVGPVDAPLLTSLGWQGWWAEQDGTSLSRVRVDWAVTWTVGVA